MKKSYNFFKPILNSKLICVWRWFNKTNCKFSVQNSKKNITSIQTMKALRPGCVSKILKYAVNKKRNKGEFIPEDLNLMRVKLVLHFKIMPILGFHAWNALLRFITMGFFYKTMLCNPSNNIFGLIATLSLKSVSPTQDVAQIKGQKCILDNN